MTPTFDEQPSPLKKTPSIRILEGLYLTLIFSLPFAQPLNFKIYGLLVQPTDIIFPLLFSIFVYATARRKLSLRFSRFYYLLASYALALALSALFSTAPQTSLIKLATEFYLFFLLIITFSLARSLDFFKKIAFVWIAAMLVIGLIGAATVFLFYAAPESFLLEYTLHHYGTLIPGNYPRIQTTFYYPAMLCHYLSIGVMLLLIARRNSWVGRGVFAIAIVLIGITLFFTLTPGLGGVILSLSLWFWLKGRGNLAKARVFLAGGIFLAVACFVVAMVSPIRTETSPYYVNLPLIEKRLDPSVRLLSWQSALATFAEHPIFGKGIGTDAAAVVYRDASGRVQFLRDAHQLWLNVAAQTGVFGLAAIILLTFYFVRRGFPPEPFRSPQSTLLSGLIIAFISAFIYQGLIGSFEEARQLWILMGLILAAERLPDGAQ